MDRAELEKFVVENGIGEVPDAFEKDCENIVYLLDNCDIEVPQNNRFFVKTNASGLQTSVYWRRAALLGEKITTPTVRGGELTRAYTGAMDFSHTCPFWEDILRLGVVDLKNRLTEYVARDITAKQKKFYDGCIRVYDAALRFLFRASEKARAHGKTEMANGLQNLCHAAPRNFFERLQTVFVFYTLQHNIEGTFLRTLGRLDSLFYPYFVQEEKDIALRLIEDFLREIDRLEAPSNIPFAIGGTDEFGNTLINPLSYLILDAYQRLELTNTKFHILYNEKTPDDILRQACACIRAGKNSIVFISDDTVVESLQKLGATDKDAHDYHIVGCYECGAAGELTCSCNARVNIAKALEITLHGGVDAYTGVSLMENIPEVFQSFDELYATFERVLLAFADRAIAVTDAWEREYKCLHASPFLSSTYASALEKGGDLYCDYTAKYNNSSMNAIGLATATDSLAAVKRLVYEEKKCTLAQLKNILKNDWKDDELLRLRIKNKYPKFGVGDSFADGIAQKIVRGLSKKVNGRKNVKGGVWRLGTFSIDWRWDFGAHTHATPDGRRAGETLSQNTSASFGMDKEGATAHLLSVTAFPHTWTPNGSIADIDLHASAVQGENGITALCATLKTYFARKGLAVHYNILDTEILKKAKEDPTAYPNLQVRLCGWNVLFSSLSEREKEEFIARSIKENGV